MHRRAKAHPTIPPHSAPKTGRATFSPARRPWPTSRRSIPPRTFTSGSWPAPGLRLIPDGGIVRPDHSQGPAGRQSGRPAGRRQGLRQQGVRRRAAGHRRRVGGDVLTTLSLDDSVWIALADSAGRRPGRNAGGKKGGKATATIRRRPLRRRRASCRQHLGAGDRIRRQRPLVELHFVTESPAMPRDPGLAQPLGAEQLTVSVHRRQPERRRA